MSVLDPGGRLAPERGSAAFFDLILEELPAGVATADAANRVTFLNRMGLSTLALRGTSYLGAPLTSLLQIPPEASVEPGETRRFAYALRRPDGQQIELGITLTSTPGLHPDVHLFALFRDLTTTRETELAARRVERLAAMGTMVAGFAHEVRNPVSAMHSLIESLDEEIPPGDPRRVTLAKLRRHLDRIERLVQTSLRFGRPETPRKARVSPARLVDDALEQLRPRTRELGEIRRLVAPGLRDVEVDEEQLVQVLVALLNNALDASGYPDQVHVTAEPAGREVCLSVRDFGPGVPDHLLPRIFDPFFTTKATGTGLGLSIAQRLVHDNGGRLEVESKPGAGACFRVLLPAVEAG